MPDSSMVLGNADPGLCVTSVHRRRERIWLDKPQLLPRPLDGSGFALCIHTFSQVNLSHPKAIPSNHSADSNNLYTPAT